MHQKYFGRNKLTGTCLLLFLYVYMSFKHTHVCEVFTKHMHTHTCVRVNNIFLIYDHVNPRVLYGNILTLQDVTSMRTKP